MSDEYQALIKVMEDNGSLKKFKKSLTNGIADVGWIREGIFYSSKNNNCFAGMAYTCYNENIKDSQYVILNTKKLADEDDAYLKYIVEESCFKNIFLSTVEDIKRDGFVIVFSHFPGNILFYGLHLIRQYWEQLYVHKSFSKLVENGVDPSVAFAVAPYTNINGDKVYGTYPSHSCGTLGVNLKNLTEGNFVGSRKVPYSEELQYAGIDTLFGKPFDISNNIINIICTNAAIRSKSETKSLSPFAQPATYGPREAKLNDFINELKEHKFS